MELTRNPCLSAVALCLLSLVIASFGMNLTGKEADKVHSQDVSVIPSLDPSNPNWPELVGKNGKLAKHALDSVLPDVNVVIVPMNAPVTKDYRIDRIRIFVTNTTDSGTVVQVPYRG